ncbi:hypothetical protein HNR44_003554 [Geomicrobium halophilum]|uniref:Uncharacterized protein n=1 Tax=Geomicrobium halophilum TaxID=549000 RepID=A0A841PXR1_9BACL|nr:hypothetical protein [Geomicrobium halophilum]MBB6451541.1 hypothetical protein [Geomicrobium halophilum]
MEQFKVKVSLSNGHVISISEEAESMNEIKNELLAENGTYNKHGVFFHKDEVVSVEISAK